MVADLESTFAGRAVGGLPDAVIMVEATPSVGDVRRIVFVNDAFTRMTGFTADEAIGSSPDITIGPETSRDALTTIQRARDANESARVELLKYRKDGTTFWAEMDLVPLFDEDRRLAHYLAVVRDVTARRQLQLRQVESERAAAVGTLAAGVAHEMNNPLAYALMNLGFIEEELVELIASTPDPALARWSDLKTTLAEVRHGVGRVAQIVRDIRAFAQLDAMPSGPCGVKDLVERAVQMARSGMPASATITTRYEDDTPEIIVDPGRLAQVVLNLIVNALDAIPPEENDRRGVFVSAFSDGSDVIVEVKDEGRGIPEDVLPRIFDPFFTTKEAGKGTGLGLSISYGIIRAAGGSMTVQSRVGEGTTVRIALPSATRASAPSVLRPRAPSETSPPKSGLRLRVLVVDDEPMICRALQRALSPAEDVTVAHSALDAIALFEAGRDFDLVLCDLSMPVMSGAGLYEQVANRWPALLPRIVIMSGGASTDATRAFLEQTPVPRLDKPIDLKRLRAMLDARRSSPEPKMAQGR